MINTRKITHISFGIFFLLSIFSGFLFAEKNKAVKDGSPQVSSQQTNKTIAEEILPSGLEEVGSKASYLGLKIIFSLILLLIGYVVVKSCLFLIDSLSERAARYRFLKKAGPALYVVMWSFFLYVIVALVFQPTRETLFAFLTASGVAVGFAAQDILKNIFGGITIILDRPFQVGDKIRVGDYYGEVITIGLRSTRIVTPDDSVVSVPNSEVVSKNVSNANMGALDCQVVTEITIPNGVDLSEARRIAWEAAVTSPYVYLKKPVSVVMHDAPYEHGLRTKLKIKAYVVDTRLEFVLLSDITERLKSELAARGWLQPVQEISKNNGVR